MKNKIGKAEEITPLQKPGKGRPRWAPHKKTPKNKKSPRPRSQHTERAAEVATEGVQDERNSVY